MHSSRAEDGTCRWISRNRSPTGAKAPSTTGSAGILVEKGKVRQGLFWCHLTVEKALKAHVVKTTGETPPKIHNLIRLAELAGLTPDDREIELLAELNDFNLEGRYPDRRPPLPDNDEIERIVASSGEVLEWLIRSL